MTPPINPEFAGPLDIYVQGRLIEESICPNNDCKFEYTDADTPSIT